MFEVIEPSEKKKTIFNNLPWNRCYTYASLNGIISHIYLVSNNSIQFDSKNCPLWHPSATTTFVACSCMHCTNISKDWNFLCFISDFESNNLKWRWTRRKNKSNRTHNCRAYHVFVDQQRTILNKTNKAFVHSLNISKTRNLNVGLVFFLL